VTRIAELGRRVAEALRDGDTLAAAQVLADTRAKGGRAAVLGVLDAACAWGLRTGPSRSHKGPQAPGPQIRLQPLVSGTPAPQPPLGTPPSTHRRASPHD